MSESGEWRKDYLEVFLPGGHGGRTYSAELCTWTVNVDGVEIVEKDGTERIIYSGGVGVVEHYRRVKA